MIRAGRGMNQTMTIGSARSGRDARGFTLVELVIVLAILVVASSFVILNLEGITASGKMRAAAREVANHIKYARSYAILSGKPIYIYYDFEENAYILSRTYYGNEGDGPGHDELRDIEHSFELPGVVQLSQVTSALKVADSQIERFDFTAEGVCLSHCVYLKGQEEDSWWTIEINGLTGRVSIYDRFKEFDGVRESLPGL